VNERDELIALRERKELEELRQKAKAAPDYAEVFKEEMSLPAGILSKYAQGASFGFADEAGAALGALTDDKPFEEAYTGRHQSINRQMKDFEEANPKTAIGSEIAGGIGLALGTMGAGSKIAGAHLLGKLSPAMRFALPAAVGGGAYGAGTAQPGERMAGMGQGALIGGLFGFGLPYVGSIAKRAGQKIGGAIADSFSKTFQSPQAQAGKLINKALQRSDLTPDQVTQQLGKMGNKATLAESMGDDAVNLLDNVVNQPGKSRQLATQVMTARNRQGAQQTRIIKDLEKLTGKSGSYLDDYLSLDNIRKTSAKPLYEKAYAQEVPLTPGLKKILNTKTGQKAWKQAQDIVADELDGTPLPKLMRVEGGKEIIDEGVIPDLRSWDYIKRGLDDIVSDNTSDFGKMNSKARSANELRKALISEIDEISPDYKSARAAYAGPTKNMDAMKQGLRVLKDDADFTEFNLSKMSESEKEAYMMGAVKAVKDKFMSAGENANAANKILNSGLLKQRIKPIFKTDAQYNQFISELRKESLFKGTENRFMGSQTFSRTARAENDRIPRNVADLVGETVREVVLPDTSEAVRDEIGRILLTQGQDAGSELARALINPQRPPVQIPMQVAPTLGLLTGQRAGSQ